MPCAGSNASPNVALLTLPSHQSPSATRLASLQPRGLATSDCGPSYFGHLDPMVTPAYACYVPKIRPFLDVLM